MLAEDPVEYSHEVNLLALTCGRMGNPKRFDAVLFDAGGVLVLPDPTVLGPLLSPFGGSMDLERHRRAHYAGMAHKSRQRSVEGDWGAYNRAYVASLGIAAGLVEHAAEVLDHTRSAHLWRWPIPETGIRNSSTSVITSKKTPTISLAKSTQ